MARMIHILPFVFLLVVLPETVRAQEGDFDPARLSEVRDMAQLPQDETMYLEPRESMGAEAYDTLMMRIEEKDRAREDFIRNAPGITPYLFSLLERDYANRSMGLVTYMVALSKRKDLTGEDVDKITSRMDEILDTPSDDTGQSRDAFFLIGGVIVLRNFPSPGNENRVIRVLTRTDHYTWLAGKQNAAETLSLIGTERSLPYLESTQKWVESNLEHDDSWRIVAAKMKTYQRNLKRRLEDGGHGRLSTTSVEGSKQNQQGAPSATIGGYFLTNIRWLFVSLVCLGLAVVGGVYLRKRTGS